MLHQSAFPTHASFHYQNMHNICKVLYLGQQLTPNLEEAIYHYQTENHDLRLRGGDSHLGRFTSDCKPPHCIIRSRSDKANRTTSSGRSREAIHRSQNWTLSSPPPCLEILSMKITNRTGDKGQPWWSPTPTETCSGGSDARSVHPHKTFWFTRRSVRLCWLVSAFDWCASFLAQVSKIYYRSDDATHGFLVPCHMVSIILCSNCNSWQIIPRTKHQSGSGHGSYMGFKVNQVAGVRVLTTGRLARGAWTRIIRVGIFDGIP